MFYAISEVEGQCMHILSIVNVKIPWTHHIHKTLFTQVPNVCDYGHRFHPTPYL